MMRTLLIAFALVVNVAADWPQWRGPHFNGSTDERGLPSRFATDENVVWKAALPGEAASTPVVVGTRVFVSSLDADGDALLAMCLDSASGKRRWVRKITAEKTRQDNRSNYASPSPVADARRVTFFFGNGELASFDHEGNRRWQRNLQADYGPFATLWTFSSSPLLYEGRLYVQVLHRDVPINERGWADRPNESYLLALDAEDGKTVWRTLRPSEALLEARESFGTPIPYEHGGRKQLLVAGGDALTAHDPAGGAELWRWAGLNPDRVTSWRLVPSPVATAGVALICAPKRAPVYAIDTTRTGKLGDAAVVWASREEKNVTSDVPTPAVFDGDFFVLSDLRKSLSRVEPRTGKVKWSVPTPTKPKYEASPLAADGKLYIIDLNGTASVVNAADGQTLHTATMDTPADGEVVRSSIVAAGGRLFIRTTRTLYCIGAAAK